MKKEGFTLIELVIVIVILGILAAVAVPKFAGLTKEAKVSSVKGFTGSLRAAANIVHGKWLAQDNSSLDNITLEDGSEIEICAGSNVGNGCNNSAIKGYPIATEDGIVKAVDFDNKTFTIDASGNVVHFYYKGTSDESGNCYVKYDYNQSDKGPKITYKTTGCE